MRDLGWIDDLVDSLAPPKTPPGCETPHRVGMRVWPGEHLDYPHTRLIGQYVADLVEDRLPPDTTGKPGQRLIITLPPQHGKSTNAVILAAFWALIRDPDCRIAIGTYAITLARKHSRAIRQLVKDYGPAFGLHLDPDNSSVEEWGILGRRGGVKAVGFQGGLSGYTVDLAIVDDPFKGRKEANSAIIRQDVWDWFTEVVALRNNPRMIVIHTRWHTDDLIGRLLKQQAGEWMHLNMPALAEEGDLLGRAPGEPLWPQMHPVESFRIVRTQQRTWNSLYQQRPSDAEGTYFKTDQLRWYERRGDTITFLSDRFGPDGETLADAGTVNLNQCVVFGTTDTAMTAKKENDWTVYAVWAFDRSVTPHRLVLLDVVRRHEEGPDHLPTLRTLFAKWPQMVKVLIENKADGITLLQAAAREGLRVAPFNPGPWGDKRARAEIAAGMFTEGRVFLPTPVDDTELEALWLPEWLEEHLAFPTAAHDDQVDNTSMAAIELLTWDGPAAPERPEPTPQEKAREEYQRAVARQQGVRYTPPGRRTRARAGR